MPRSALVDLGDELPRKLLEQRRLHEARPEAVEDRILDIVAANHDVVGAGGLNFSAADRRPRIRIRSNSRSRRPGDAWIGRQIGVAVSYVDLEKRVLAKHPLRVIKSIVDEVLVSLDSEFAKL
jgi:hypothetical protein